MDGKGFIILVCLSLIENVDATLFFYVFSGYMLFGVIFFARFYKPLLFN